MALVAGTFIAFASLWAIVLWLAIAFFCATVASAKNLSRFSWLVGGFFFGPIALIAVAGMPVKPEIR